MKKLLSVLAALVAVLAVGAPASNARPISNSACFEMLVSPDGYHYDVSCP